MWGGVKYSAWIYFAVCTRWSYTEEIAISQFWRQSLSSLLLAVGDSLVDYLGQNILGFELIVGAKHCSFSAGM